MLALLDAGRRAWSFITAHWKGAVILLAVLLVWGYGRWQYSVGEAHADAIWAERVEAARVAAEKATAAQNARLLAANGELRDVREQNQAYRHALDVTVGELRYYAARPRNLPQPADFSGCMSELAAERERTDEGRRLLAEGAGLLVELWAERADALARVNSACDAWPR